MAFLQRLYSRSTIEGRVPLYILTADVSLTISSSLQQKLRRAPRAVAGRALLP